MGRKILVKTVCLYVSAQKDFVYGPDTVWQREFEENVSRLRRTEDQIQAIEDTKARHGKHEDHGSASSAEMLGYGKTEIAIRAAF